MCEVENEERVLNSVLSDTTNAFVRTGSPNIICSVLPHHWRSNKQLPCRFKVVVLGEVADNTTVTLSAANEFNDKADLKNNVAHIKNHMAVFQDLRFIGRSGRGRRFHVVITVATCPRQVAVYRDAIKVTIDGPRSPRNKGLIPVSQVPSESKRPTKRKRSQDEECIKDESITNFQATIPTHNSALVHQQNSKNFINYKTHNNLIKTNNNRFNIEENNSDDVNNSNDVNNYGSKNNKTWITSLPSNPSTLPFFLFPLLLPFPPVPKPHSLSGDSDYSSQSDSPPSSLSTLSNSIQF